MIGLVGLPIVLSGTKGRDIKVVVLLPVLDGCFPHHLQAPAQKVCNLLGSAGVAFVARGRGLQAAAESRVEGRVMPGVLAVVSPGRPGICILPLSRMVRITLPGNPLSAAAASGPTAGTPTIVMPAVPASIACLADIRRS